jgi:hypothetical protein
MSHIPIRSSNLHVSSDTFATFATVDNTSAGQATSTQQAVDAYFKTGNSGSVHAKIAVGFAPTSLVSQIQDKLNQEAQQAPPYEDNEPDFT